MSEATPALQSFDPTQRVNRLFGYTDLIREYLKGNTDRRQDMLQGALGSPRVTDPSIACQTTTLRELQAEGVEVRRLHDEYLLPDLEVRALPVSARREVPVPRQATARAIEVAELRNALVVNAKGAVRCEDGRWISDINPSLGAKFSASFAKLQSQAQRPMQNLPGTSVLLASPSSRNYYHWLHQTLPKIDSIQRFAGDDPVDRWLVHDLRTFSRDILQRMGIDSSKITEIGNHPVKCDRLIIGNVPNMGALHYADEWPYRLIRNLYLGSLVKNPWRKVYFRRADGERRPLVNTAEVEETLARKGFEFVSMEESTVQEQARIAAEASVIVSPHGAALANLVFCAPGAKVVELLPRLWPSPLYGMVAQACGLNHHFVLGVEPSVPSLRIRHDSAATKVSIERLIGALEA